MSLIFLVWYGCTMLSGIVLPVSSRRSTGRFREHLRNFRSGFANRQQKTRALWAGGLNAMDELILMLQSSVHPASKLVRAV